MNNQADILRVMAQRMKSDLKTQILGQDQNKTRVITVCSGKGGVGKSNFVVNLGIALAGYGQRVILLDADLGLANLDVLLGIVPSYNLAHVMAGEKTLSEILYEGPNGIKILPGGTGMHELTDLTEWQLETFLAKLSKMEGAAEYLLIDTGAGLSKTVLSFTLAADEIIVITTVEPTAITDAYGLIKTIRQKRYQGKINIVVNRVASEAEALVVYNKLKIVINRFLKHSIDYLGCLREDPKVGKSVQEQQPFFLAYPNSIAAHDINTMAAKISNQADQQVQNKGIKIFLTKVAEYFR